MIARVLPGALLALAVAGAQADTVKLPDNNPDGLTLPGRGLSMDSVEERFGSPTRITPAVGEPPITRWVYPQFTVYFEHEYTITAVRRPQGTTQAP